MNDVEFITNLIQLKYDNVRNMFALKFDYKNFDTHNVIFSKMNGQYILMGQRNKTGVF